MVLILILVGAILGSMVFQELGGAVFGGVLGYFVAWALKLNQRLDSLQRKQDALDKRLQQLQSDIEMPTGKREPAEKPVPGPHPEPRQRPAAKAVSAVTRIASDAVPGKAAEPPRHVMPPASPIPPKPAVPKASAVPPSEVERPAAMAEPPPPAMTLPPRRYPEEPPQPSLIGEFLERWVFSGNPIVKIGVVILFLGLAFALRYAAEHGLLPIWLRYTAVAATGLALVVFGWRWREREDNYGLVLQGAGIGVLYLTTLAAMKLHPLLPLGIGFALLVLIAAFAAFLAVKENAVLLAVFGALGGFAAPVLASTGAGSHIILFSYLTVLNLGIVAIAWFRRWRVLNILGYVCSFALGSAWAADNYQDALFWSTEPFLLLLFGIYVLITVLFARRTLADAADDDERSFGEHLRFASSELKYVDGSLAFGVPFSTFWVQHLLMEPYAHGTAFSAMGFSAFYFLLAFVLFKGAGRRYLLLNETLIALGAIFGTLSIPLLETSWTAAAWAIEAAGVYWIGYRQQQLHVRLFALFVLIGSASYFLPELRLSPGGTVLDGPILSAALLTISTSFAYWLMSRAGPGRLADFELDLRPIVVGFAALMLATLPLLLLAADWAGATFAVIGTGLIYLSRRMADRALLTAGWLYQAVGGLLFLTTLEAGQAGAVLGDGWLGLLQTCLVGLAMLAGAVVLAPGLVTRSQETNEPAAEAPVGAALLAGLAFINLAPLFVLSWRFSAMIWPVVGIATLAWAISVRHKGVILFSLALQAIAGVFHWRTWVVGDVVPTAADGATAFLHSGFIGPVVIALAGFACAYLMHSGKRDEELDTGLGWVALGWGGAWWAFAWAMEIVRVVPASGITAALIAVTLATAWSATLVSGRLGWQQLEAAALAYLPVLVLLGARDAFGAADHPGAGWGALGWPLALAGHSVLLRTRFKSVAATMLGPCHVAGALLFVVLASLELRWWLLQWFEADSAWPLLGGMLVPLAYLWAIARPRVQSAWPVREFFYSYFLAAAVPMAAYLLGWLWLTNVVSTGASRPLPYFPVVNPLELAYLAILAVVLLWWRFLRRHEQLEGLDPLANTVLAATAFAAVTGGVVRACHHWGAVPWDPRALFASDTVQASLSIVWGALAISLMLFGNRRRLRSVWIIGAGLVGIVVVKLFLVELSAVGTLQRIVSFIVVGLLLLLVGYIAPLPPRADESD